MAHAQTQTDIQTNATNADPSIERITVSGGYTVSEVIDTATGLGLTLRETPQSVSVITELRVQDQALDTIVDTVLNAVGVSAKEIDNVRNTLQARGFEISNYQIDGVPLSWSLAGDSGETIQDVSIYERIEFVRGATGLLTGAGDPSASINLVRKRANSTELTGFVNAAIGSWESRELSADVSTGLNRSGTMRGRVVAKYQDGESFLDLYEDSVSVLYGVFEADVSKNTLVRVGASYQNNDPTSPTWGALPSFYTDGSTTDWDVSTTTAATWTEWETTGKNVFANVQHSFANGWELLVNYNNLKYEQSTELLYLSGVLDKDTGIGLSSFPYKSSGESSQNSYDIQLKGDYSAFGDIHEFVLGAIYSEQSADTLTYAALTNAFLPVGNFFEWNGEFPEPDWSTESSIAQDMDTEQKGFYGATRFHINDDLKVIVGARLSSWDRTGISYDVVTDFGEDDVLIPYTGVLYDINQQHRVYASYTEIFQPQNAQDRFGDFLDSIKGKSKEIGLKSTFLNDALHTSVAVFRIEQDNLAQPDVGYLVPGTVNTQAQREAQGTVSEGFELEVVGQPVEGWNINAGYSYFNAEDAQGIDVNTDHPRKQFKLFTTYQFVDALPELTVGGGVNWQDETYSVNGSIRLDQEAYSIVNLMARYDINPKTRIQVNLDNLFDKKYFSQIGFFEQYRYGTPRQFKVTLNYRF
ncbi:TonB-dependent siderophore receptor [Alteromonas sp. a30]|uniref:TonB-dependent siderophore receptor n=1 Tax=Alteromonas sp. a30 TaxID=2730917 RepID=UPI0022812B91|nr:TonB-dependent siderophore receptor [Alteromonas sp. a30]